MAEGARGRQRMAIAVIGIWVMVAVVALGSIGMSHSAPMPAPADELRLARAASALAGRGSKAAYVHVIDPACSCSAGLLRQLLATGARSDYREVIVFVGEDSALRRAAEGAGFAFRELSRTALVAELGLEVAPVLIALDSTGALRYAGGYFDKPAAVESRQAWIHARLMAGEAVAPLPVYGCAASERLRERVDPLGVVYRGD